MSLHDLKESFELASQRHSLDVIIDIGDLLKELKNPVHGDRNKADDVSWPFYNAIDEILGYDHGSTLTNDLYIDPHEFLCVSVTPEEITSSVDALPAPSAPEIERRTNDSLPEQRLSTLSGANCSIEIQKVRPNASRYSSHRET